jgi:hypothetical protein
MLLFTNWRFVMSKSDMTTTKIDRETLSKLRMLASRNKRTSPKQLSLINDNAFRTSPAEVTDQEFFVGMMDSIVESAELGIATEESIKSAKEFSAAGRICWGEENGTIIGVMADGSRCDVNGTVLSAG